MFHTSSMLRLHHFYFIQTLLEFQRQCNIWYARLKHKFTFLLHKKRLQLTKIKSRLIECGRSEANYAEECDFEFCHEHDSNSRPGGRPQTSGGLCGQLGTDLNQMLVNSAGLNSVSVPIQMLLLPFIPVSPGATFVGAATNEHQHAASGNKCSWQHSIDGRVQRGNSNKSQRDNIGRLMGAQSEPTASCAAVSDFRSFMISEQARKIAPTSERANYRANHLQGQQQPQAQAKPLAWFAGSGRPPARLSSCAMSLRNPLVCFPSTSNHESGHVKYM